MKTLRKILGIRDRKGGFDWTDISSRDQKK